ncbi:hypothetical protein BDB00DRAFT_795167 [Zychaea mexicana]|uniref:uncharacterized protein n=1 Tax=Zychaea mexicana TaxID=64656 RepID=UPI0022FE54DE|nr:uncharacterized protein BDB00DRAFT_795167 [Zychaea mexicana]KAI9499699.1 hypothetical protein BDB00DRAFT_795167 [Zychaea mexicana]
MEQTTIKLFKKSDKQELFEFLRKQSTEEISEAIRTRLDTSGIEDDVDPILFIRAIIVGSPVQGGDDCTYRRFLVFREAIAWYIHRPGVDGY